MTLWIQNVIEITLQWTFISWINLLMKSMIIGIQPILMKPQYYTCISFLFWLVEVKANNNISRSGTYTTQREHNIHKLSLLLPADDQIDSDPIDQFWQFSHIVSFLLLKQHVHVHDKVSDPRYKLHQISQPVPVKYKYITLNCFIYMKVSPLVGWRFLGFVEWKWRIRWAWSWLLVPFLCWWCHGYNHMHFPVSMALT